MKYRWFIGVVLIVLASCIEPVDLLVDRRGGSLVISAALSNLSEPQYLEIGTTSDLQRIPIPVTDAVAYIFSDNGSRTPYTNLGGGRYQLQDQFRGYPGVKYVIEVTLPDGRTYKSSEAMLPEARATTHSGAFTFKYLELTGIEGQVTKRPVLELTASAKLPADSTVNLRWAVQEVYIRNPTDFPDVFNSIPPPCYISADVDPQSIVLFNGNENRAKEINQLLVATRFIDKTFLEKHYFVMSQHSITAEALDYWRKVNLLANQTGSIFDAPPAALHGNFRCISDPEEDVFGFFEVRNSRIVRFYTLPSDIPVYIPPICTYVPEQPPYAYEPECLNCLSLPNSSLTQPSWFK